MDDIILDDPEQEVKETLETIKRVIKVEEEIKGLKQDIKEIWENAKNAGVDVPIAKKSLVQLKREYATDKSIKSEVDDTISMLKDDVELNSLLIQLVSKD